MASASRKTSNLNLIPETPIWKHPATKEQQRDALLEVGFFTFKSRYYNANDVRNTFFKTINLLVD